ncbi:MAG: cobalamin biosynthesis protein CobD [Nitrospinae bacterium]|nr:cobalamin biosynthesis protein CobD [Nitrospinota bacterium]
MLELHYQILLAFLLDLMLGDPAKYPHPVRIIGAVARRTETATRRRIADPMIAGALTAGLIVGGTLLAVWMILHGLLLIHPIAYTAGSIFLIYTSLSVRCLFDESKPVLDHLSCGREDLARVSLSKIVGRDTARMDKPSMVRATVETIAEGMVDGIIAPLFYAFLGGAPLALAYKAINTMDSMFGYRNEKYMRFGKFPARLDDAANWIPARIAAPIIALGSALCGFNGRTSLATAFRDGQNHLSPNAGIPEAAVAGALGIRLGGSSFYDGQQVDKPYIGDGEKTIEISDISRSHRIMFVSSSLTLVLFFLTGRLAGLF